MNRLSIAAHRLLIRLAIKDKTPVETFSQAGEDILLQSLFSQKIQLGEPGFYVDIGAYHPVTYSNTNYFYKHGWRGVNVEPRPGSKSVFETHRSRDINLEMAVSDHRGTVDFYHLSPTSTINTTTASRATSAKAPIAIPCDTLDNILAQHLPSKTRLDFVSIDVEGAESSIVSSTDWRHWRPRIVVVEANGKTVEDFSSSPVTKYLGSIGYPLIDLRRLYWPPAEKMVKETAASLFFCDSEFYGLAD